MSNTVDKELLDQIYAEYVRLSRRHDLPAFHSSHLTGDDMLKEYKEHLKDLSKNYLHDIVCKPPCNDGSCPPCDSWGLSQYLEYREKLRSKSA
jgi:hypothetical protein